MKIDFPSVVHCLFLCYSGKDALLKTDFTPPLASPRLLALFPVQTPSGHTNTPRHPALEDGWAAVTCQWEADQACR